MCALKELELRTTFASQVNYLVDLLRHPDFEQNREQLKAPAYRRRSTQLF